MICGTDLRMFKHGYPGITPDTPLIPGHELSGVIEKAGKDVKGYSEGIAVAVAPNMGCGICDMCTSGNTQLCGDFRAFGINIDGAFAEYVKIPADAVRQGNMVELTGLSFREAALAEPLSCVYNAFEIYDVQPADVVLVIGAGPIGMMHGKLAKMAGAAKVIINDVSKERLALVKEVEPGFLTALGDEIREMSKEVTKGRGIDVTVTACPAPEAQVMALELTAINGRVSFFGGLPKDRSKVPLDTNLVHYRQIRISGTTRQSLAQYRKCIKLMSFGLVDVKPLITHTYKVDEIETAYSNITEGKGIKHSISFE
jgi:L-iditol 2-dehydrogenase